MKNKTIKQLGEDYAKSMGSHSNPNITAFDFIQGFRANKKLTEKTIRDTLNKYRSWLSNEQIPKLGKVLDKDRIEALKLQLAVLIELQNKLK